MIFLYKCGHEGTEGLWADDKWYKVDYICPVCKRKAYSPPKFKMEKKGKIVLLIKLNTHQ